MKKNLVMMLFAVCALTATAGCDIMTVGRTIWGEYSDARTQQNDEPLFVIEVESSGIESLLGND